MSAPTPDFLPGSRPPVTPREKAADAVWRFETYDGASLVTSRDCDGVARAALTAALGSVEETARVIGAHGVVARTSYGALVSCTCTQWRGPRDMYRVHQAEALHAHLLAEPETKEPR